MAFLTLPGARPYPFTFPLDKTALIIIDIQRDFVDPGGFGSIQCGNDDIFSRARSVVPATRRVLDVFRATAGHVIHTREGHRPDLADLPAAKRLRQISNPNGHHFMGIGDEGPMGRLLVRGEYGHDIVDELQPWPTESVIDKPGKGSFWGTNFHRVLLARGVTHLIFAGVTTECCVTTTLRECSDRGYQCCVLSDCTQGFEAQQVTTSLDIVCAQDGLFGFVGHSSDFLKATADAVSCAEAHILPTIETTGPLPTIKELQELYKKGLATPLEVVNSVFDRIDAHQKTNPAVWTSLSTRQDALAACNSPVWEDNIDVAGVETTSACPAAAYRPNRHAVAVQHVLDAGGIYIGKTNLDQLPTGLSGCRSPHGIPRNSFSPDHIPGGSSSGAAVAIGTNLVSFSLSTDTAGSTLVPSALNGVTGLKPTTGTISARGLAPACKSLDTIGIIARTIEDTRTVWRAITHQDADDPFSKPPRSLATWHVDFRGLQTGGFTFAVPPTATLEGCAPTYQRLFARAVEVLQSSCGGHLHDDFDYRPFDQAANLPYGGALLYERITSIGESFIRASIEKGDLHPALQALFSKALAQPPSVYDIFRDQALQVELTRFAQRAFDTLDGGVDVLLVPTTVCHPTIEEILASPLELSKKLGKFAHFGNVLDLCAVTVPVGTYKDEGGTLLPFGVTIFGGSGFDAKVLDVAAAFEEAMALEPDIFTSSGVAPTLYHAAPIEKSSLR